MQISFFSLDVDLEHVLMIYVMGTQLLSIKPITTVTGQDVLQLPVAGPLVPASSWIAVNGIVAGARSFRFTE